MARVTNSDLQRRLALLEAENAALRERAALAENSTAAIAGDPQPTRRRRSWAWTLLAVVLVVIGALLAPVAVVAAWTNAQLTDTDRFVAAYAPLAEDPQVQSFVTAEVISVIEEQVDIPALTEDVIDGVIELGTGPAATQALNLLKGPAANGIQSLVESAVDRFVTSDAFANVWATALRVSHSQITGVLQGQSTVVVLGDDGTIGIQLAPIIAAVKDALVNQGIGFASAIPEVDRTIVLAQSDALPTVQLAYGIAVAAGVWLPWIALLFLVAGVLVARRRFVALIAASVALAVSMAVILIGFGIGRILFTSSVSPSVVPSGAATVIFNTLTGAMRDTAVAVLVVAIVVAIVGWFTGPFAVPIRLRGFVHAGAAKARAGLDRWGLSAGKTGRWMYRQRLLLRAAVAVVAALLIVFVRPLTPALTFWTLFGAIVVVLVLEILERPDDDGDLLAAGPGEPAAEVVPVP